MKSDFRLTALLSILIYALLLISCKGEDDSQSGIVGRVTAAEGGGGGAIVKLIKAPNPEDDSSIWSVNDDEPQLGFPYALEFTFDHRPLTTEQVDTANGSGEFRFEQVVAGDYVIIAEKPGHGWSVPKKLSTSGGDVDVGELRLPLEVVIEEQFVITENTTWESGVHYVVKDNFLVVDDGVTLTIEPGAIVRIVGAGSIEVDGTLIARGEPDNFVRFMANEYVGRRADRWIYVKFNDGATPPDLEYCAFRDRSDGTRP